MAQAKLRVAGLSGCLTRISDAGNRNSQADIASMKIALSCTRESFRRFSIMSWLVDLPFPLESGRSSGQGGRIVIETRVLPTNEEFTICNCHGQVADSGVAMRNL